MKHVIRSLLALMVPLTAYAGTEFNLKVCEAQLERTDVSELVDKIVRRTRTFPGDVVLDVNRARVIYSLSLQHEDVRRLVAARDGLDAYASEARVMRQKLIEIRTQMRNGLSEDQLLVPSKDLHWFVRLRLLWPGLKYVAQLPGFVRIGRASGLDLPRQTAMVSEKTFAHSLAEIDLMERWLATIAERAEEAGRRARSALDLVVTRLQRSAHGRGE